MPAKRVIDTAVVEIIPSFPGFEQAVDRQVDRVLEELTRNAERSTETIERSFLDLEQEIADVFNDAVVNGTIDMERLSTVSDLVTEEIGDDFQRAGEVAERAFAELERSAKRDLSQIQTSASVAAASTSKGFGIGALAGTAAFAGIGTAAVAGLGAIAAMGLTSAAQLEQVQISFNALLGSVEEGERVFKDLQKFAAVTPFEFPEVAAAAKRFLAFNEQVGMSDDMLQGFLTTVGDLASVTGAGAEGMNRIVLAIGQIASKGKVSLEELMQIGEAVPGFSAIGAIAQSMGISTGEAMERISAGTVDATTGINALLTGMQQFPGASGAMEKQSQTLLGVFSTFKDTIGQALADAFTPVIPQIKEALTMLTPIIGDALKDFVPALGQLLAGLMPVVGSLVKILAPIIGILLEFINAILVPLMPLFDDLVEQLGGPLKEVVAALAPVFVELIEPFGLLLSALIPLIPPILQLIVALAPLAVMIAELLALLLNFVTVEAIVPLVELLVIGLNFLVEAVAEFVKWLGQINWGEVGDAIGGAFSTAWNAVSDFFVGLWNFFKALPGNVLNFIKSLPERFVALIKFMFDSALRAIGVGIGLIIVGVTELPGMIISAVKALPGLLFTFFSDLWNSAKETTVSRIDQLIDFLVGLPSKVFNAIRGLIQVIPQVLGTAFDYAKSVVMNAIDSIVGFVTGLPARIGQFAVNVGQGILNFIRNAINYMIGRVNEGIATVDNVIPGTLPRIPLLAHGGIAMGPAIIGENPNTAPEAAIPLGDSRAMRMLANAFAQAQGGTPAGMTNNFTVVVEIDGQQIDGRVVRIMDERDRTITRKVGAGSAR